MTCVRSCGLSKPARLALSFASSCARVVVVAALALAPLTASAHGAVLRPAAALDPSTLDVEVVNLFLRQSAEELPAGVHAVLIWDGAGYHTSPKLVVPASVSSIRLVPYATGLNPVENLWHDLRRHYWSLRVYADVEAPEEAAMSAWRSVCSVPDRVR